METGNGDDSIVFYLSTLLGISRKLPTSEPQETAVMKCLSSTAATSTRNLSHPWAKYWMVQSRSRSDPQSSLLGFLPSRLLLQYLLKMLSSVDQSPQKSAYFSAVVTFLFTNFMRLRNRYAQCLFSTTWQGVIQDFRLGGGRTATRGLKKHGSLWSQGAFPSRIFLDFL